MSPSVLPSPMQHTSDLGTYKERDVSISVIGRQAEAWHSRTGHCIRTSHTSAEHNAGK